MAQRQGVIQKTKGKALVTPTGSALWVKVTEPDFTYDPKGKYEAQIVVDPADPAIAKFIETLTTMRDAALEEAREGLKAPKNKSVVGRDVVAPEYDREGEETGKVIIKAKAYAVDFDGNPQKIEVFDVRGRKEDNWTTLIGNGSKIKLQVWASAYHMANGNIVGISLKLKKIQVIDLSEFAGASDGFGDESGEEGFGDTADNVEAPTVTDF